MGKQAVEKLNKEGIRPSFHQLEIDNEESVKKFADYIKQKYGGFDVLVNNAAILCRVLILTIDKQIKKYLFFSLMVKPRYMFKLSKQ